MTKIRKSLFGDKTDKELGFFARASCGFNGDKNYATYLDNRKQKGFNVIPESKIKYVCGKFLERNPGFNSGLFRIKLCCDGVSLSRTKINLLNFSLKPLILCNSLFFSWYFWN